MGSSVGRKSKMFLCSQGFTSHSLPLVPGFVFLALASPSHLFHAPLVTTVNHAGFPLTSLLIQSCSPPELSCSSRSFFLGERLGVSALCSAQCFAEIVQSPSAQWNKIFSAAQMIPDCVHVPQGAVELEVNSLMEAGMGSVMNRVWVLLSVLYQEALRLF